MRKHAGMKPQDVAILLKLASLKEREWIMKDIAEQMKISLGEFSYSISRSVFAGLISEDKAIIMKPALIDFLQYGIRYVFPVRPGEMVRGIPTSHAAPPLNNEIRSSEPYVWKYAKGKVRGRAIEPLYKGAIDASLRDPDIYELLALTDALRVGRVREQQMAIAEIKKRLNV
ncbi:MAG: hypothetical protein KF872_07150 [Chitinophagales bacterium]|nr:hypothetical protein [Chitinophagales bacterium]